MLDGECKLCMRRRPLCKSHIIPEWAYRPLYDERSQAIAINSEDRRRRNIQQGLWERMFCLECEDFFNKLDEPFFLFWNSKARFPASLDMPFLVMNGIDYAITKELLLSVLWRAHVAERGVLSAIDLGPHADKIKGILQREHGAEIPDAYPTYCYLLRDPDTGGIAKGLVQTPMKKRTEGHWNYEFAFLGCGWKIFVSSSVGELWSSCLLKMNGTIVLPVVNYPEFPGVRIMRGPE